MLVLTRRAGESIMIADDVRVVVLEVRGDTVRLGIEAPRSVQVHRAEVYAEVQAANAAAALTTSDLSSAAAALTKIARPVTPRQRQAGVPAQAGPPAAAPAAPVVPEPEAGEAGVEAAEAAEGEASGSGAIIGATILPSGRKRRGAPKLPSPSPAPDAAQPAPSAGSAPAPGPGVRITPAVMPPKPPRP